jgi:hypothetical protein
VADMSQALDEVMNHEKRAVLALESMARSFENIADALAMWCKLESQRYEKEYPVKVPRDAIVTKIKAKKTSSKNPLATQENLSMTGSETLLVPEKQKLSRTKSDHRYERRRKNSPLTRLGVDPRQLIAAPKISPILREIPGGKRLALKAMRFSETECIQKFLAKYDSISPRSREIKH